MLKSKTFWTAIAGMATAIGSYFAGDMSLETTLLAVFQGLLAIFLRHGIQKAGG